MIWLDPTFFFCVLSFSSGVHHFWWDFCVCEFFNPTIGVVTFGLCGWLNPTRQAQGVDVSRGGGVRRAWLGFTLLWWKRRKAVLVTVWHGWWTLEQAYKPSLQGIVKKKSKCEFHSFFSVKQAQPSSPCERYGAFSFLNAVVHIVEQNRLPERPRKWIWVLSLFQYMNEYGIGMYFLFAKLKFAELTDWCTFPVLISFLFCLWNKLVASAGERDRDRERGRVWLIYKYIYIYLEGFQPEWCISTIYHAWDTPFWLGTLEYIYTLSEHNNNTYWQNMEHMQCSTKCLLHNLQKQEFLQALW